MKVVNSIAVTCCRIMIAGICWFAVHVGSGVTIRGTEQDGNVARLYLGMTHKRDIDPLILVSTLIFRRKWRRLARDMRFALRGDGFSRGFLARLLGRPTWFAWLLRPLAVGPILRWLGFYPTDGLMRPAEEWIREAAELTGDVAAGDILAPAFIQECASLLHLPSEQVGVQPLTRLLAWRNYALLRKFYGPEIIMSTKRRPLERRMATLIHAQLDEIVASIWQGNSFVGAPEGQLSPDGHLSPLHAGFKRIIRAAPPDLRIVPVALSYDFMTSGRKHVFITIAPALTYAPKLAPAELAASLRRAWLLHAYFTCTQLASGFLLERCRSGRVDFTLADLASAVQQQAQALASAGRVVDPRLLSLSSATKRARGYLAYAARHDLIQRGESGRWRITFEEQAIQVGPREVAYHDFPLLYAYNELQDLLSIL